MQGNQDTSNRQYERHDRVADVSLTADGQLLPCKLVNISVSGARLNVICPKVRDKNIIVGLGNNYGQYQATTVWQSRSEMGVQWQGHSVEEIVELIMGLAAYG